jgi:DNA polymerase III sliding clamp (beta) subunit (PCNA family)
MTKIVFETATLADAVKNAASIAPAKGAAFDQASGIIMVVVPGMPAVLKATNLEVFYTEWVDNVAIEGPMATWRIPSMLFSSIISAMPIGSGKTVSLEFVDSYLEIVSGTRRAKIRCPSPEYFPTWDVFDPDKLEAVEGLGARIKQVAWAASRQNNPPRTGIHLDGSQIVATDGIRLARVPCDVPLVEPITVPATLFAGLLPGQGETRIAATDAQMLIMPNDSTQIRTVIYDGKFPDLAKAMKRDHPGHIEINARQVVDLVNGMLGIVKAERDPKLSMIIGDELFKIYMTSPDTGEIQDHIEIAGQAVHAPIQIDFTPANLVNPLEVSPNQEATIGYRLDNPKAVIHFDGGSGYEAWAMPRVAVTT